MAWDGSVLRTNFRPGPFQIGVGAAAAEVGVGECSDMTWAWGYDIQKKYGGAFFGTSTVVDAVVKGFIATAEFVIHQTDVVDLARVFALATLSSGATSKSLIPTAALVIGKSLYASATRIRFHYMSEAVLTDETQDIIVEKGIIIPRGEMTAFDLDDERVILQPCEMIAFYNATDDSPFKFGVNAA
jgi:hypothetical protein